MGIFGKVKALFKIKGLVKEMKLSEIKTSEGRMALILNLVAIYSAGQGFIPPTLAAKIAVVSLTVYTVARAAVKLAEVIAKLTPNAKDDEIVAEAGRILDVVAPKAKPSCE